MPTLFRRDAVVAGGLINALTPLTASILAAQGAAPGIAAAVHFTPLPDNVLLFAALGRPPQRRPWPALADGSWLVAASLH